MAATCAAAAADAGTEGAGAGWRCCKQWPLPLLLPALPLLPAATSAAAADAGTEDGYTVPLLAIAAVAAGAAATRPLPTHCCSLL